MTRKRHTEEQIIAVLKEAQAGVGVQELCRKHGISDPTFYKWRAKYSGLEVSDVKRLRQLEEENRRLKQGVRFGGQSTLSGKELVSFTGFTGFLLSAPASQVAAHRLLKRVSSYRSSSPEHEIVL